MVISRGSIFLWISVLALAAAWSVGLEGCEDRPKLDPSYLDKPASEFTAAEIANTIMTVETNKGSFKIAFDPETPETARHMIRLIKMGYFSNHPVSEIVPGTWVVFGDTRADQAAAYGQHVPFESAAGKHKRGAAGIWHPTALHDEGGGRFYVMIEDQPSLDRAYTVFGTVVWGMSVVRSIGGIEVNAQNIPQRLVYIKDIRLEAR